MRFAAFGGVLILVSGLVLTLFDDAAAASISITTPSPASGSATFYADIVIPNNEKIPISSAKAIIENNPSSQSSKTGQTYSAVASATCGTPIVGCPGGSALTNTLGSAITAISLSDIYVGQVGTGYTVSALGIGSAGYVSGCAPCQLTRTGGYGYDNTAGYGYGGAIGSGLVGPYNAGQGYGYTLGTEDLIMRFSITVNTDALSNAAYWFTFEMLTGSAVLDAPGPLSSPATSFTVQNGGGGGGGGGTTSPPGTGDSVTVNAGSVTAPPGATAAFRATGVTQTAGNTVIINTGSDFVGQVVFTPSSDISGATIDVVHYPADNPPPGTGNIPQGLTLSGFVQVTISSGGETHTVTIAVTVPPGQAEGRDPSKAVLLKWSEGDGRWVPKGRITLTQDADGGLSGQGTSDCCSDFAVAFDEEDPTVTLTVPSGTLTGAQTLTAEASDNLQVAKVEFYVDDSLVNTVTESPFSYSLDTSAYSNGAHTIRALAYDSVDNTAEASESSTFENEDAPTQPGEPGGPSDGDDDGISFGTILIILIVLAVIGAAGYYFYNQSQKR